MENLIPDLLKDEDGNIPVPPVDRSTCALLGSTALAVQGMMAVLVLVSLIIKRFREQPRRPWPVWMGDVSKQIIGQGFLHSTNILFSTLMQHTGNQNACTAYFLSILIDCTLGVLVIYSVLRIFSHILTDKWHLEGFKSGQYYHLSSGIDGPDIHNDDDSEQTLGGMQPSGQPRGFQITWWARQLMIYILTLVVMKLAILGFFWIPAVFQAGDWLLSWMGEDTKIVFVLMIFPLLMNAFQFLLIDTILKSKGSHPSTVPKDEEQGDGSHTRRLSEDGGDDEENQALLRAASGQSRRRERDDSVLHAVAEDEEDARSLRGGNLLPSGTTRQAQTRARAEPPSPVYPPAFSAVSPPIAEKTPPTYNLEVSEKVVRSTAASPTRRDEDEKSDNGWDWLDEDEADDTGSQAKSGRTAPLHRASAVV